MYFTKTQLCSGRRLPLALTLSLLLGPVAGHADALLDEANGLIEQGQAEQAYQRLLDVQIERAGEPRYDYLFGIAAADAGHPNQALFAFDRVLATQPNHPQAHAERARAYYLLGEYATAKREFNAVLAQRPPAGVRSTVQAYLDKIDDKLAQQRGLWEGVVSLTLGSDSNVNSATSATQVAVPVLGSGVVMQLAGTSQESADSFAALKLGGTYSYQHSARTRLFATAQLEGRRHGDMSSFDTDTLDFGAGAEQRFSDSSLTLALFRQRFRLDGIDNRQLHGFGVDWRADFGPLTQYGLFAQMMDMRFPGQSVRDNSSINFGLSSRHQYVAEGMPSLSAALYVGQEHNRSGRPDLARDTTGLRLDLGYKWSEALPLKASLTLQSSRQQADDPLFLDRRTETMVDLSLSGDYRFADAWVLTPSLRHTRNDANLDLYDYSRNQVALGLSYKF